MIIWLSKVKATDTISMQHFYSTNTLSESLRISTIRKLLSFKFFYHWLKAVELYFLFTSSNISHQTAKIIPTKKQDTKNRKMSRIAFICREEESVFCKLILLRLIIFNKGIVLLSLESKIMLPLWKHCPFLFS